MTHGRILVTGSNGFIGRALCERTVANGWHVTGDVRRHDRLISNPLSQGEGKQHKIVTVGDIGPKTDWTEALEGVYAVVHLAARVHVMRETAADSLSEFRRVNVEGTARLGRMAASAEVKRMIYISSIGVNGKCTQGHPFTEEDAPNPYDPYTISKWEAEQALQRVSKDTGLEIVVLRPPLVYGPNAPGNFGKLMRLVQNGVPLPFRNVKNIRSFIYINNLVDAIVTCVNHPRAANETFLVSDGQDISTPEFIRMIAFALGKKPGLLPFPPAWLRVLGKFVGKREEVERLIGSLFIDSSKIKNLLNWKSPFTTEEGIKETVKCYKSR